jgi:hypothetical protein
LWPFWRAWRARADKVIERLEKEAGLELRG